GVELSKVRTAVEFTIGRGNAPSPPSETTLAPRTKKVIDLALDEAKRLGHPSVGTAHLLLGLARDGEGIASGVLEALGHSREKVRHEVSATLAAPAPVRERRPPLRFGAAAPSGAAVMDAAAEQAKALGHDWLGSEHILLGLLLVAGTRAGEVLADLGI